MKKVIAAFMVCVSLSIALVVVNHLMPSICTDCKPNFILQAATNDKFESKYIYWGKSYCETHECDSDLEKFATSEVISVNEDYGNCENIVFLGDSFTDSPWDGKGKSYSEHFVDDLSMNNHSCYRLVRLATNGTGNDQQFARFSDIVASLHPKLVVWQFYWNDFFDNVEKPLYLPSGDTFQRERAYRSIYFWSGWLYQKLPVKDTNLGNFLLYFGELKKDKSVDWFTLEKDHGMMVDYSDKKIKFFLDKMKDLEKKYDFKLITTISPLECSVTTENSCAKLDDQKKEIFYTSFLELQNEMMIILQNNSNFVSMYENESMSSSEVFEESDFWEQEQTIGSRHLGASGQEKAGDILFLNFISREELAI